MDAQGAAASPPPAVATSGAAAGAPSAGPKSETADEVSLFDAGAQRAETAAAPSVVSVLRARAEAALLDVVRDAYCSRPAFALLHIFGLAQLLLMPLAPDAPWRVPGAESSIVVGFQNFLLRIAFAPWRDALSSYPPRAAMSLFIIAASYVLIGCALIVLATVRANVRSLSTGFRSAANRTDIVVLRWATRIGIIALPVPLLGTLLDPLSCSGTWAGFPCWSGVHTACVFIGVLFSVAAVVWLGVASAIVHLRTVDLKVNPLGAAHGRIDFLLLMIKFILAAVFALGASTASPIALALVNFVGGIMLTALMVTYLPFYDQTLNRMLSAFHCVFLASAVSQLLGVVLSWSWSAVESSVSAGLVWIFIVPLGFHAGWTLADVRWRSLSVSKDVSSPYVIELRARSALAHCVQPPASQLEADALASAASNEAGMANRITFGGTSESAAGCPVVWGSALRKTPVRTSAAELLARTHAERILKEGAELFSTSAIMCIFLGAFMFEPRDNKHLERLQLHAANDRADWFEIDVAAFLAQRNVLLEESEHAANKGKMTVKLRMHFEALQARADANVADSRTHILAFWTMLCERHPDLTALVNKGTEIYKATRLAESDYKDLLVMAPLSVPTLRKYAVFLAEVVSNPALGEELLEDADQLEDEATRASGVSAEDIVFGASLDFDLTTDGIALVTVSSSGDNIGTITDANVAALILFGYAQNKREVLGRNVNVIIAEPFATVHDHFLADFAVGGVLRISGRSTVLFGLHRDGHIFPMHVHVSASTGKWTAALEEIKAASLGFLLFLGKKSHYRVTAACRRSLRTFGFSVARLRGGAVALATYVEDPDAFVERVLKSQGGSIVAFINTGEERVYASARIQEISVPHLNDTLYVMRFREASAAEVDVAIATKVVPPRVIGAAPPTPKTPRAVAGEGAAVSDDGAQSVNGSLDCARSFDEDDDGGGSDGAAPPNGGDVDADAFLFATDGAPPPPPTDMPPGEMSTVRHRPRGAAALALATATAEASRASSVSKKQAASVSGKSHRSGKSSRSKHLGGKSVSSSDTAATASILSTAEMIRRGVYSRAVVMEASLLRLKFFIILLGAVLFSLNIARQSASDSSFQALAGSLDTIKGASLRSAATLEVLTEVQAQLMHATAPTEYTLPKLSTWSNERLRVRAIDIEVVHRTLFLAAEATGGDLLAAYSSTLVPTAVLHPGEWQDLATWNATVYNSTFASVMLEFVSAVRELWYFNTTATYATPSAFWLVENGRAVLLSALSVNNYVTGLKAVALNASSELYNVAFSGTLLAFMFGLMFAAILPGLSLVLTERRQVFDVFTQVPPAIVSAMRLYVARSIVAKKANEIENDGSALVAAAATALGKGPISDSVAAAALQEEEHELQSLARKQTRLARAQKCCRTVKVSATSSVARAYTTYRVFRNAYSGRTRIFTYLIAPVLIFAAYTVAVFTQQRAVLETTASGRASLMLATELRSLVQSTALHTRFAVASKSAAFAAQELGFAQRDSALLAAKLDLFAYGDDAKGIPSALASSTAARNLLIVNGCVDNSVTTTECANYGVGNPCVYYYTTSLCARVPSSVDTGAPVFAFGVVGTGLLPAVAEFLTDVNDMLRVRALQLAAAPPLATGDSFVTGTGAIVDAMGSAYLPAGFGKLVELMTTELQTSLLAYNAWNIATIAASSFFLLFSYFVVYNPILNSLDEEIKRTRFLLLLFPEDVARLVPAVSDIARRLLQGGTAK